MIHSVIKIGVGVMALLILLTAMALPGGAAGKGKSAGQTRKIVLIAGPLTGHDKQTHEYEKSVILLKYLLDTAPNLKGVHTEACFKG